MEELSITKSQIEKLSENLQRLLKEHRVSENTIAQALGIPVMTVRRIVSGETTDPRISTLKLLADYFSVFVDSLIDENGHSMSAISKNAPRFIPVFDWKTAENIKSAKDINLNAWKAWHPIAMGNQYSLSDDAFALESRPSMNPRFPHGTIFIIDPKTDPTDSDIILMRVRKNNELSLRELIIDPPEWQLHPVVPGSQTIPYSKKDYEIVGVVVLTLMYNKK